MSYYLIQASYTAPAVAAMVKNPQDRAPAVKPMIERAGGKLHEDTSVDGIEMAAGRAVGIRVADALVPADIVRDIIKRPFILVGSLALLMMLPLAATSMDAAVRALGGRRWRMLARFGGERCAAQQRQPAQANGYH